MVPGCQHDEITSQPPFPPTGIRARWQTKLLSESDVNRPNLKADDVIILWPLQCYQHLLHNGKFKLKNKQKNMSVASLNQNRQEIPQNFPFNTMSV